MIRAVAAGLGLAALLGVAKGCPAEGGPAPANERGGNPGLGRVVTPVTFRAHWQRGFWMNIVIIIDGDARGPYERSEPLERVIAVEPGKRVELHLTPMQDPPPGATVCAISAFGTVLMPNGYAHRQDGRCAVSAVVPAPPERA